LLRNLAGKIALLSHRLRWNGNIKSVS
jgi:hypothetical protein